MKKNVALVLASGGARGLAHIGAIEELQRRGYRITSIAGCSIGSLIGGIYAAGKIAEAHDWFTSLNRQQVLSLTDFSFGLSHIVKGEKVLHAIQQWVPDCLIEDLPIPAAFVATDLINSEEVVFRSGSLFRAIRASISIPMCFKPVDYNGTILVDGGLVNPFPLNLVQRHEGDILVGINISGRSRMPEARVIGGSPAFFDKLGRIGDRAEEMWNHVRQEMEQTKHSRGLDYISLVNRTIDLQIQASCRLMTQMMKPDVLVEMAQDAYTTFDFDKASEIIDQGRLLMSQALDCYEQQS